MILTFEQLARVIHAAMAELNTAQGQSYPAFDEDEAQRHLFTDAARYFVQRIRDGRELTGADAHEFWMDRRVAEGWTHGPVRDYTLKQHPSLVPFKDLPADERAKDWLYVNIVYALWRITEAP